MLSFYTCDSLAAVTVIPQIVETGPPEIKMEGKISMNRFETYMALAFNQYEKKVEKMISGWIESSISIYQSRCDQMAKELLEAQKVSMASYNTSSKIFFLHKDQIPDTWKSKLNFRIKLLRKNSNPSLCFIIVHKPYKVKQPLKYIEPKTVFASEDKGKDIVIKKNLVMIYRK